MYIYDEPVRGDYPSLGFLGLPGLERMRAGAENRFPKPPIHHLFGSRSVDAGDGWSVFAVPVSPWLQTVGGFYLGGVVALAADAPLGGAIVSKLDPGVYGVTSELSINFLRPATAASRELIARARLVNIGRTLGLSEASVEDAQGTVLAHTTSRYFLTRLDPAPPRVTLDVVEDPVYESPDPWQRPAPAQDPRALNGNGLDVFRALIAGELAPAPFSRLFGIRPAEAEEGRAVFQMRASRWLTSPARTIYGGIIALLADAVMTAAVNTTVPSGHSTATIDLKVQYLRPGLADDREITAAGTVVHRGKNIAVTQAEIRSADGKALALATGSSMILARPWQPVSVADEQHDDEADA